MIEQKYNITFKNEWLLIFILTLLMVAVNIDIELTMGFKGYIVGITRTFRENRTVDTRLLEYYHFYMIVCLI